jgi:hypothetical protein
VAFLLEPTMTKTTAMKKDAIIAAVKEYAASLGRVPSVMEFQRGTKISKYHVRRNFGTYTQMLSDAGLQCAGQGHLAELHALFLDWAGIVREMKKIPTIADYDLHSKFSVRPLTRRYESWTRVAGGMREYAIENGLEVEWEDVLKVIADYQQPPQRRSGTFRQTTGLPFRRQIMNDQPVYGQPLLNFPMTYAPTNENGVIFAFGSVARELGFSILRIQAGFPDCEAMREIEPGRCQRVRIEFEHESRNFMAHMHPVSGCDLIVCWYNNWPDCPLEVLELSSLIGNPKKPYHGSTASRDR